MEPPDPLGIVGTSLGRYRIVQLVGSGGMASVYLGQAEGPGGFRKRVAVKVLDARQAEEPDYAAMFLDEARTAALLSHPNIVTVFDFGRDAGFYWIAMEYLRGASLRKVLEDSTDGRHAPLPLDHAVHIVAMAATGLHAAHELRDEERRLVGLVHRDVSPHNVFVGADGIVKMLDFGIAKVADRIVDTRSGVIKGKLGYLAPEQALLQEVDRRTDIFALGVVLWECLARKRLFRGATDEETLKKLVSHEIEPPSKYAKDCPPELNAVTLKALARSPAERHETARHLARELEDVLKALDSDVGAESVAAFMRKLFGERGQAVDTLRPPPSRSDPDATVSLQGPTPSSLPHRGATPAIAPPSSSSSDDVPKRLRHLGGPERTERSFETKIEDARPSRRPRRSVLVWLGWLAVPTLLAAALAIALVRPPSTRSALGAATAEPTPPSGSSGFLSVHCAPECTRFVVDGKPYENVVLDRVPLSAGNRTVECIAGGERRQFTVTIAAQKETVLKVNFD